MTFFALRRLASGSLLSVIWSDMGTEQSFISRRIFDTESRAIHIELATASGIASFFCQV